MKTFLSFITSQLKPLINTLVLFVLLNSVLLVTLQKTVLHYQPSKERPVKQQHKKEQPVKHPKKRGQPIKFYPPKNGIA